MFRLIGAALLPLGGWLAGDIFLQKAREHIRALEWTVELLQRIRQEIEFRRADLCQIDRKLHQEGFFSGRPEHQCLQELSAPEALSLEEKQCFRACLSGIGRQTEAAQECERLREYIMRFQEFLQRASRTLQSQAGLPHRLGLAAGAILALALI